MADLAGQSFAGCEIIAKLGQGGFGAVYKARQVDLDRFVAIKVLSRELSEDPEYVARFKQEAAAAAKLSHSGIVQVYAAGSVEGTHYFIMEFVDGESVQRRIDREGKIEPREALAICIYVAEALEFAWQRAKLIHRDVKPDNIFLSADAQVKLGDLGLAKQAGASTNLTRSGMMMGTPNFISPEQAQAKKEIDFRADIYSLGCTLYYMVTGRMPYEGAGDALAIIHKHCYDPRAKSLSDLAAKKFHKSRVYNGRTFSDQKQTACNHGAYA
ncbi:MAG: serine/threonine protein kinase [Verrucomicrobiae bacterium]|nr:serine/threonine protein kinase [Verrucomicrobiae bacterium]